MHTGVYALLGRVVASLGLELSTCDGYRVAWGDLGAVEDGEAQIHGLHLEVTKPPCSPTKDPRESSTTQQTSLR